MISDCARKYSKRTRLIVSIGIAALCFFSRVEAYSQISATTVQNLSFGAFTPGSTGGTITVAPDGSRTVTSDVIALNLGIQYYPAIFEVEAPLNAVVSILSGGSAQLSGSNGGSMTLQIGASSPSSPFISGVAAPQKTAVKIGATLTVGDLSTNPAGSYSGSFSVTFVQE